MQHNVLHYHYIICPRCGNLDIAIYCNQFKCSHQVEKCPEMLPVKKQCSKCKSIYSYVLFGVTVKNQT